jgi:hypothetical protein
VRPEGRRDRLRLLLRELEEPRQDFVPILGSEDLPELDDAGQAKPAIAEGLDDLGEPLDELGGGLPVEGGALRQAELAVQEVEERGAAELEPQPSPVEVRQLHQELAERGALASEEVEKAGGEIACGGHLESFARVFEASPNARIRSWTRERGREARPPSGAPGARRTRAPRARSGIPACRAGGRPSVSEPRRGTLRVRCGKTGCHQSEACGPLRKPISSRRFPLAGDVAASALVVAEPGATRGVVALGTAPSPRRAANERTL